MKKKKPVKKVIKPRKKTAPKLFARGRVGRGTIFVVVILTSLIFVAYVMVGGTLPETIPAPRASGIVAVDLKKKFPQEQGLQMHTFQGATITPYPTAAPGQSGGPGGSGGAGGPGGGAPPLPPIPVAANPVFKGDFNPGSPPFGQTEQCPPNTEANIKQDVVKTGSSGHFKVGGPASCLPDQAHRAQMTAGADAIKEGDERWYTWSTQYAIDFPNPNGQWFYILEWSSGTGQPVLGVSVESDGNVIVGGTGARGQKPSFGIIKPAVFTDYVLQVKFSANANTGFVRGWENGFEKIPKTNRVTLGPGQTTLKIGIHRDPSNGATVHELWHDELVVTKP